MKISNARRTRLLGLVLTTAIASAMLTGCAGHAPSAAKAASQAETALAKGKGDKAVTAAEVAVLAAPRDGETRALLGAAYIEAGRFTSAAAAFKDAMQLGDTRGRTVLSYSLMLSAQGRYAEAQTLLARYERNLDDADYGLAITLAGSPQQGIETLSNALRYGNNTAKVRQNLAYAFALKGDWRSARLLAAQDVTADRLDARLGEWAQMATPQMAMQRVAALLGVSLKDDAGQPDRLALTNFPNGMQMAAEAAVPDFAPLADADDNAGAELAVVVETEPDLPAADAIATPIQGDTALALAKYELPAASGAEATSSTPAAPRIVLPKPVPVKAAAVAATPSTAFKTAFVAKQGDYRVQLGSFASMSAASDGWTRFVKRHPELKDAERVVTKANVNGKIYYRVAAGGFARESAVSFCSQVKQGGGGCLAYAASRPLPGTVATETRVAAR